MANELSAAVFVDRDGTIMHDADYCSHPKQVKIFPGVVEALQLLKSKGFKIIVITNQSGIGRGFFHIAQNSFGTLDRKVPQEFSASLPEFEVGHLDEVLDNGP